MQPIKKQTIYIDCTNTVFSGLNTGIQRVVRNIIQRISSHQGDLGTRFVPVVAVMGCFYRFDADISDQFYWTKKLSSVLAVFRNALNMIFMNKHDKGDWPVDVITNKPEKFDVHGNVVHFSRKIIPNMFKCAYRADGVIRGNKIKFKKDDILFLADAFWKESLIKSVLAIDNQQYKLIMLIYDLFPISHPQFVDSTNKINYINCLKQLVDRLNGVVSISNTSLQDIKEYISRKRAGILYDYFYLGADFSAKGKITGNIRPELVSIFDAGSVYLAVGTIEPRKNYDYLLDAFQQLWVQNASIKLFIVGRVGWMCDDLMKRIETSEKFGQQLIYFKDLNDDELEYCYGRSKAVIFPSKVEGFGLPLVEAMHYGKPVFASDIEVFREIGKEYPLYFDLKDSVSLAELVIAFENGAIKRQFTPQQWLSWDESVDDLLVKVIAMAEQIPIQQS